MASLAGYGPCGRPVHNMVFFGRVMALWFGRFKTCPFMAEPFITWSLDHNGTRGWLFPLRPKAVVSHGLYCLAVIVVHELVVLIMGLSSLPLMTIL